MKEPTQWPEIYVESKFLRRKDIIEKVVRTDATTCHVTFNHPVLGTVTEIYELLSTHGLLCLKCCFPHEMQNPEEMEIVKDYYNNFILEGHDTYLEYNNENLGWYVLSRNVEDEEKEAIRGV